MNAMTFAKLMLVMAAVLAASLQGLAASGHFPDEHRKPALRGTAGSAILFGGIALSAAAVLVALYAARGLPWYALVIGAGAMLLVAPIALQPFPDRFVDGRGAPLTFATISVASALTLLALPR